MENSNKKTNPTILISILNWNNAALTERCLSSLQSAGYLNREDLQILVSDNGSRRDDAFRMADFCRHFQVRFRANETNRGFAGGHNEALQEALDDDIPFVWILNNDAVVPPGALEELLSVMQRESACGCVGPRLAYEDTGKIYFAGSKYDWRRLQADWCPTPWDNSFHSTSVSDIWSLGTANLLRTKAIREVGLLDDGLFAYYDDDDIGARLKKHGWRTIISHAVVIGHGVEHVGTTDERPPYFYYLMTRNRAVFYLRFTPRQHRRFIRTRLYARAAANSVRLTRTNQRELAQATLLGIQDAMAGRLGPPALGRKVALKTLVIAHIAHAFSFLRP